MQRIAVLIGLTAVFFLAAAAPSGLSEEAAHSARVIGTKGKDTLRGTGQADTIRGKRGRDRIFGLGGSDRIFPGYDLDRVFAGPGNDVVFSSDDFGDVMDCGPGRDIVLAGIFDRLSRCEQVRFQTLKGRGRANPIRLGAATRLSDGWWIRVLSVDTDATDLVLAEPYAGPPPDRGKQFVLVRIEAGYRGFGSGVSGFFHRMDLVGPGGVKYRGGLPPPFGDSCGGQIPRSDRGTAVQEIREADRQPLLAGCFGSRAPANDG